MTSYAPGYFQSGNQQPNFAGGMNNQQPGQAPNMGVPNMGVPPAPMPYSPYPQQPSFGYQPQPSFGMPQPYNPYPQQSTFGMPPYNPYPQQQPYGQTSYSPAYSPMGQQPSFNNPYINSGITGPINPPSFGTGTQPSNTQQPYGGFGGPDFGYIEEPPSPYMGGGFGVRRPYGGFGQPPGRVGGFRDPRLADGPAASFFVQEPPSPFLGGGFGGQQPPTYSVGPMGLPVTIDQSLMGGAATGNQQPTLAQWLANLKNIGAFSTNPAATPQPSPTLSDQQIGALIDSGIFGNIRNPFSTNPAATPQPPKQPSPYKGYGGYDMTGMSPTLQAYLKDSAVKSTYDAAPYYAYDPTTKSFSGGTRGGQFNKTLAEMEAEAAAWDTRQKGFSTADQSPFAVNPTATPTSKPSTPNIAPKLPPSPQPLVSKLPPSPQPLVSKLPPKPLPSPQPVRATRLPVRATRFR